MATVEQIEKKRSRQVEEILATVNGLVNEVSELKAGIAKLNIMIETANQAQTAAKPPVRSRSKK